MQLPDAFLFRLKRSERRGQQGCPRQENLRLSFLPLVFVTSLSSVFIGYVVNEDGKKGLKETKGGKSLSIRHLLSW